MNIDNDKKRLEFVVVLCVGFILFLLIAIIFIYNTWSPYHLDSALYGLSGKIFVEKNKLVCTFPKRCGTCYTYAFLSKIFGVERAHKLFVVISIFVFLISVSLFLQILTNKERFDKNLVLLVFFVIIATLSTPAGVITAIIGKEDFYTLGLFVLSLYLALHDELYLIALGGIVWSFSLWTKQSAYMLTPMLMVLLYKHNYNFKKAAIFLISSCPFLYLSLKDLLPVIIHQNPNFGQFYGLFSHIQVIGIRLMGIGLGYVGIVVALFSLIIALIKKDKVAITILINVILIFLYLTNLSVVHYRHALWIILPSTILLAYSVKDFNYRFKFFLILIVSVLSLYSVVHLIPNFKIKKLNLPKLFPFEMYKMIHKPAIILGMDNCGLVRYYTGLSCVTHPAFPFINDRKITKNLNYIKEKIESGYNVYVYPDFFAYDPKKDYKRKFFSMFKFLSIGSAWFEDYHRVYIYPKFEKFIKNLGKRYKVISYSKVAQVNIYNLGAELYVIYLNIGNSKKLVKMYVPVYKGLALYGIFKVPIYQCIIR